MRDYAHVLSRVFNAPLMLAPDKAQTIAAALVTRAQSGPAAPPPGGDDTRGGVALAIDGGVAVLSVSGSLVHRAMGASPPSGLAAYADIGAALNAAAARPEVRAILLDIDSAGGEASDSVFEMAALIRAVAREKTLWAVADETAASAAYALASGASRIVLPPLARVGSIGVLAMHLDVSSFDEKNGFKWTFLAAGARKLDGNPHAPLADAARDRIAAQVDALYDRFVELVAGHRRIAASSVRRQEAAVYQGADALKAGLADAVLTPAEALAELTQVAAQAPHSRVSLATNQTVVTAATVATLIDEPQAVAEAAPSPETSMTQPNTPPVATQPAGNVVDINAVRTQAESDAIAYVAAVHDACRIAKLPEKADAFISARTPLAEVNAALMRAMADRADAAGVVSRIAPDAAVKGAPAIDAEAIYAARAEAMGQL